MDIRSSVISFVRNHEAFALDLLRDLVRIESPSHYKAGVDRVGETIAQFCRDTLGYYVRFQNDPVYGNCLAACSCPFDQFQNGIVISAHMDTVHELGAFQPVLAEDAEYIYGPGAGDCKGGVVMALLTALTLKNIQYDRRPIKLLFAADEESGGPTGGIFYPRELAGADYMFNAESGIRGKVVTGRKSSLIAVYHIFGEAAHIGYITKLPKSAIREAALKLLALEDASDYDTLTFSAGIINGGTVATSAPAACTLQVNVRIMDSDFIDKAISILEKTASTCFVPGTSCRLEIRGNRTPMSERPRNISLCRRMSDISESLGFGKLSPAFVGGASDAAYASQMDIPVVCATGPVVDHQHTTNERVLKSSLAERAIIHALTILSLY